VTFDEWLAVGTGLRGEGEEPAPGAAGEKAARTANVDDPVSWDPVAANRCLPQLFAAQ
jgi:hypothetical protein